MWCVVDVVVWVEVEEKILFLVLDDVEFMLWLLLDELYGFL